MDRLALIAATTVAAALCMATRGLSFPPADLLNPLGIAALLGGGALYYRRKGERNFEACLAALLHVTLYSAVFSVLMYAVAALGRPFVDDQLCRADALCGVHLPAVVHWTQSHPDLRTLLQGAYNSLLWQTPLVIILLGFTGDRSGLRAFVRQFILSTLVCAVVFALWPAEGPFSAYGYAPSPTQARYLDHLHSLRDGSRTVISWRGAEGLITFPSFHTCWAILLAWSLRRWRGLNLLSAAVNLLVIASTLTTGWHYFTDVAGGAVTAAAAIAFSVAWERRAATVPAREPDTARNAIPLAHPNPVEPQPARERAASVTPATS